jgi:GNAT superfamily N-acetyltransferase
MIRKAKASDIDKIALIYEGINDLEEAGKLSTGWIRGVYPTRETAKRAAEKDEMFVYEDENGDVAASAVINNFQDGVYEKCKNWSVKAPKDKIMVIHTLTVDQKCASKGVGRAFIEFYEKYAKEKGCVALRLDTNEKNERARAFYNKLGYRETGVFPCEFNGIPNVNLVLFEKLI